MLPITSTLAALSALALFGLSVAVSLARMKARVKLGTGEDERLLRHIRAQGNFVEYVPLALILCGLAEYRAVPSSWLLLAAGLLIVGRILHAAAMLLDFWPPRPVAMVATYASLLLLAGLLLSR